jgi:hypothetical protein
MWTIRRIFMGLEKRLEGILGFDRRPVLVFDADADALAKALAQHTGFDVHLIDFRDGACPPLFEHLDEIRDKGGLALIAFDDSPDRRLYGLLGDLMGREGWVNRHIYESEMTLIVSTSVRWIDRINRWEDLERPLREMLWVYDGGLVPDLNALTELFGEVFGPSEAWTTPGVARYENCSDTEYGEVVRDLKAKQHHLSWARQTRLRELKRDGWMPVFERDETGRPTIYTDRFGELVLIHRPPEQHLARPDPQAIVEGRADNPGASDSA